MMVYIPYMTVLYMVYNPQQTCEAGDNPVACEVNSRSLRNEFFIGLYISFIY